MKHSCFIFLLFIGFVTQAQIVNIPDNIFKAYLIDAGVDTNNDGEIQLSEAEIVTRINVSYLQITSLEGIQSFSSLERLYAAKNWNSPHVITEIDLSNNFLLTHLDLLRNGLEDIDLSNNINLIKLVLSGNHFSSIDLSNNISLIKLELHTMEEDINNLDLSSNINLEEINVVGSNLSFLNIQNGNNLNLRDLSAWANPLLLCILVDDENYVYPDCVFAGSHYDGWCIDGTTILSEDCILGSNDFTTSSFVLSPNPVRDQMKISGDIPIGEVKVYSLQGSLISVSNTAEVDVTHLTSGLYFAEIITENGRLVKKFLKQ